MNTYMHVTDDMQKNAADKMKTLIENSGKSAEIIEFPAWVDIHSLSLDCLEETIKNLIPRIWDEISFFVAEFSWKWQKTRLPRWKPWSCRSDSNRRSLVVYKGNYKLYFFMIFCFSFSTWSSYSSLSLFFIKTLITVEIINPQPSINAT